MKKRRLLLGIVCAVVLAAVMWGMFREKGDPSLEEMTHTQGPCSCAFGDLNYYLPEGCSQAMTELQELSDWERMHREKKGMYPDGIVFSSEEKVFGGIRSFYLPENSSVSGNDWIHELGLPEFEDETLGWFGGSSVYGLYQMEFFTDLPGGAPFDVHSMHYFFLSEDGTMAYDLWFDLLAGQEKFMQTILESCAVGSWGHNPVETE